MCLYLNNYLRAFLILFVFVLSSCTNGDVVESEELETEECVGTQDFISDLRDILKTQTRGGTDNFNSQLPAIIEASIKYLEANGVSYSEFCEDRTDPRIAVIAMGTAEYFKNNVVETRGDIGSCVLAGLGINDLYKGWAKRSAKAIIKTIGKNVAKKVIPAVGWGIFIGEVAVCLVDD